MRNDNCVRITSQTLGSRSVFASISNIQSSRASDTLAPLKKDAPCICARSMGANVRGKSHWALISLSCGLLSVPRAAEPLGGLHVSPVYTDSFSLPSVTSAGRRHGSGHATANFVSCSDPFGTRWKDSVKGKGLEMTSSEDCARYNWVKWKTSFSRVQESIVIRRVPS